MLADELNLGLDVSRYPNAASPKMYFLTHNCCLNLPQCQLLPSKMDVVFKCVACLRKSACKPGCICVAPSCASKLNCLTKQEQYEITDKYTQLRQAYVIEKATHRMNRYATLNKTPIAKRPDTRAIFKARKSIIRTGTAERVNELGRKIQHRIEIAKEHSKRMDELCAAFERMRICDEK